MASITDTTVMLAVRSGIAGCLAMFGNNSGGGILLVESNILYDFMNTWTNR